jgi:hypothetical protein
VLDRLARQAAPTTKLPATTRRPTPTRNNRDDGLHGSPLGALGAASGVGKQSSGAGCPRRSPRASICQSGR